MLLNVQNYLDTIVFKKKSCLKIATAILAALLLVIGSLTFYLQTLYPTASPITSTQYILANLGKQHARMQKETIGFLPYWRLDDSKYIRFDLLSEIIFFSLTADQNGQIVKVINNQTDPGWRWWRSETIKNIVAKTQISGSKFAITVAMQKNKNLEVFLDNKSAQQTLIDNLLQIVKDNKLNGLNLDFEYDGKPDDKYRQEFVYFAQSLTSQFRTKLPEVELSIDTFPLSVEKPRLYDLSKLAPLFDKVIVMSYDYYSSSSDKAGPVAPMNGYKEGRYFFDVTTTYDDYLTVVPKEKLIMGVPYYGWDWPVEDGTKAGSKTLEANDQNGYPVVISYGRAKTDTDLKPENCQWDDLAKEKWCYYTDSDTKQSHQVWLEDKQSIETKFNFAKDSSFAGIAIWTLGYDKDYPDLWQMLKDKMVVY